MNTAIQTEVKAPYFGARAAGVILIVALVTYIFGDYLLLRLLRHFQETAGIFSLQENNENEIMAMRSAILGVVNPALTMVVCVAMLRTYFPRESIKELFNRFGLVGRPSLKLLVAAFLGGMAYLFFFSKVLMHITHLALYLFPIFMVLIREITGALFGSIMAHSGFNFAEIFF